ncbi:hypothetical protein L1049_004286 [Liquidambar formosana]|uniref:Agenet domain-containing protein n=1 Tax=Liquidambar formosana TaxID=63359 RepID=A0AAP0RTK3_LIQFO
MEDDPFKKGTVVEVSGEDEGFRGSWYLATILKPISKKTNKLYLQYHTLMAENDPTEHLRESVDVVQVRPKPPREANRSFKLSEEVDAFHNDGWWEGVVTEVLENKRYSVFFRTSRKQIQFDEKDLRLHREWVHGKWVPPLGESLS